MDKFLLSHIHHFAHAAVGIAHDVDAFVGMDAGSQDSRSHDVSHSPIGGNWSK